MCISKIKPDQLSKGSLYCKIMQYGIKLGTEHQSETNNNFESSHLKSITFYNISIKINISCDQIIFVLNILPILGSTYFFVQLIDSRR